MKNTLLIFLSFIIALSTVNAQKGIDFNKTYPGGGRLSMNLDSAAKNVYYSMIYPNQPNTFFNYMPDVNNASIQINFRKNISAPNFRYTILEDDKPVVVNQSINEAQLQDAHAGGDEELFRSATLGIFPIKGKVITVLVYSVERPQDIDKSIFYGMPFPKAEIKGFSKASKSEKGFDESWTVEPKKKTSFTFSENDLALTLIKDRSTIDYIYTTTIKDKQTNKIIFESPTWQYGGIVEEHHLLPAVRIDKNVFKKSGDYEIIIRPSLHWTNCRNCDISAEQIEKHVTRHMISIILDEENYSRKDLIFYGLIICAFSGAIGGAALTFIKKKEAKKLVQQFKEKEIAKLQLNSIRSQLNPHFLFNALSGIQNLMNKNEIDNANKYLSKFARLTRNVLDDKELVSLSQEKALLHDYLQMEQLRFGFTYIINHSEDLDLDNIEIPSMLLQPFVENAVKHGISQLATRGEIIIAFIKQEKDLVLTVTDNGQGFDLERKNKGLGLPLSDSRISLLNSVYKENRFILGIISTTDGTKISLTLTDWL